MNNNLQSKYQFIEGPLQQLPMKCSGCGTYGTEDLIDPSKSNNHFLDFNLEIEFYGKIFFCRSCLTEVANQMDYHSPEQWDKLLEARDMAVKAANAYATEVKELRNAVAALSSVLDANTEPISLDSVVDPQVSYELESESEAESGLTEQTDVEGRSDLSDDDSLELNLSISDFDI